MSSGVCVGLYLDLSGLFTVLEFHSKHIQSLIPLGTFKEAEEGERGGGGGDENVIGKYSNVMLLASIIIIMGRQIVACSS